MAPFRIPFIVALLNALLWLVQTQLNHAIASWNLSVFLGGLAVAFASLRLTPREGAKVLVLTGLWFDAAAPVPFGLHAFFFLLAHVVIHSIRTRLAREETLVGLIVAAIVNLGLLLALTAALIHRNPAPLHLWPRLIADSLASFSVLILIGPWFFAFSERVLEMCGVSLHREQRGIV